jgi:hypothetical protein
MSAKSFVASVAIAAIALAVLFYAFDNTDAMNACQEAGGSYDSCFEKFNR